MTTHAQILALAADYDRDVATFAERIAARDALLDAVKIPLRHVWTLPSGMTDYKPARVVSRWVAASRRAAKNPAPRLGRPPSDRTHRLDVPATTATRDAIHAHATRTGKSRATVAGDFLEVGAKVSTGEVEDG